MKEFFPLVFYSYTETTPSFAFLLGVPIMWIYTGFVLYFNQIGALYHGSKIDNVPLAVSVIRKAFTVQFFHAYIIVS